MSDINTITPGEDDFNFTFKNLQEHYKAIGYLVSKKSHINNALHCYVQLSEHPVTQNMVAAQNRSATIYEGIKKDLQRAVAHWKEAPKASFQRDYAKLVEMASRDCQRPLGIIDEAYQVISRALSSESAGIVAGISHDELLQAAATLRKLQTLITGFQADLKPIHSIGNMAIKARESKRPNPPESLARIVSAPAVEERSSSEQKRFEQEGLFWGIVGILSAEKDSIINQIGKTQPEHERAELLKAFMEVSDTVSGYAKFAIEQPDAAVARLKAYIPNCREALNRIKQNSPAGAESVIIEVLEGCIAELGKKSSRGHEPE